MPVFHAIAAMSENRVIGNQGKIPWHIPDDFRWFKHKTMGGTLVMGRKTFESIGKPLPGRKTVVLTHRPFNVPGVDVCSDVNLLLQSFSNEDTIRSESDELVRVHESNSTLFSGTPWICGGAEVYRQFLFLPQCMYLYLTRVKRILDGDALFPAFEDHFSLNQVIHETPEYRVERWLRRGWTTYSQIDEDWPFEKK